VGCGTWLLWLVRAVVVFRVGRLGRKEVLALQEGFFSSVNGFG